MCTCFEVFVCFLLVDWPTNVMKWIIVQQKYNITVSILLKIPKLLQVNSVKTEGNLYQYSLLTWISSFQEHPYHRLVYAWLVFIEWQMHAGIGRAWEKHKSCLMCSQEHLTSRVLSKLSSASIIYCLIGTQPRKAWTNSCIMLPRIRKVFAKCLSVRTFCIWPLDNSTGYVIIPLGLWIIIIIVTTLFQNKLLCLFL